MEEIRTAALTPRQREIVLLLAEGHTSAQAARLLWVTERTVKAHVEAAMRVTGAKNRTHLVAIVVRETLP